MCHRVGAVVYDELRGKRRPIVAVKDATTEKVNEPGPARALIVVSRHMKAKPGAAVFHIVLERRALLCFCRKIIDPQNRTSWKSFNFSAFKSSHRVVDSK